MNSKPWNLRVLVHTMIWVLALMTAPLASAQSVNVSGTVYDPVGEVLIGVSVSVKGNQQHGIATDFDGNYTLDNVPSDATLVLRTFSYKHLKMTTTSRD